MKTVAKMPNPMKMRKVYSPITATITGNPTVTTIAVNQPTNATTVIAVVRASWPKSSLGKIQGTDADPEFF